MMMISCLCSTFFFSARPCVPKCVSVGKSCSSTFFLVRGRAFPSV